VLSLAITPLDIRNKKFRKTFRGYDEEEVDDFINQIVNQYESLFKENIELKESLAAKESNIGQYKDLEDTLKKTLVVAQQAADGTKQCASREADIIVQEARLKAEQIVAGAEEKAKNLLKSYEDVQKQAMEFKVKIRSYLQSQLDLVGDFKCMEISIGDSEKTEG
jgi:cell division initiation protein